MSDDLNLDVPCFITLHEPNGVPDHVGNLRQPTSLSEYTRYLRYRNNPPVTRALYLRSNFHHRAPICFKMCFAVISLISL